MIDRYCSPQMGLVWSPEHLFVLWAEVEVAVLSAQAQAGVIPAFWAQVAHQTEAPSVDEVREAERTHHHEMVAFLEAWGVPNVHLGVTSSDIQDLALLTQLEQANALVGEALRRLDGELRDLIARSEDLPTTARTHGQQAQAVRWAHLPTDHLVALRRAWARWVVASEDLSAHAKLRGPTGNYAPPALTPEIESAVLEGLGFAPTDRATQVTPRDLMMYWAHALSAVTVVAERIATQIRLDVQTGVGAAVLARHGDGSSSMPHKTNPADAEQVCGLARVVRALCGTLDVGVTGWGHRDLTNSSVERVVLPQVTAYAEHLLDALSGAVSRTMPLGTVPYTGDSAANLTAAMVNGLGYFSARAAVNQGYLGDLPTPVDWLDPLLARLGIETE